MTDEELFYQQLGKIREFQINDLRNADLKANANFLVCVGCLNATELLGGILTGLIGNDKRSAAKTRFQEGLTLLGAKYVAFREDLWALRNAMVHAYVGSTHKKYDNVAIGTDKEPNASHYPQAVQAVKDGAGENCFIVNVTCWTRELEASWDRLLAQLRSDKSLRDRAMSGFKKLPYLR